jgi:tetratricopeptide (TPR) repeat protein
VALFGAVVAATVVASLPVSSAWAGPASQPAPTQEQMALAKPHYDAGEAYYNQGQFEDAAREFLAAYKLSSLPDLLYDIAQCYDHLRDDDNAEKYYKMYLQQKPDAQDRPAVEASIKAIDDRRATASSPGNNNKGPGNQGNQTGNKPPNNGNQGNKPNGQNGGAAAPAVPSGPGFFTVHRNSSIAAAGTGVVLIVAIVTGLVASDANNQLHTKDPTRTTAQADNLLSTANTYGAIADVSYVVAVAGAVFTGYLFYRETQTPDHGGVAASIAPTVGGAAFSLSGTF